MSYKYFIPNITDEWDVYWKKTDVKQEVELTRTDGLNILFERFLPKNGKIIEAGCGMGKWLISLSEAGYNIVGVDTNKFALEKLQRAYPKAKTKLADILKLPFPDGEFDAYLSLGVVEHFEEGPNEALAEAYRILANNGLAIVEVPFDSPIRKCIRLIGNLKRLIKFPFRIFVETVGLRAKRKTPDMKFYEYRYSKNELTNFMKQAGFNEIHIFPKDDIVKERSIALWLDFSCLQKAGGKVFELNSLGIMAKALLNFISPFSYSALIVAIGKKKGN